ncbi:MAG: UDP-N-acetylmuramate:L-alanyl-gamma-D-glutamyl-meso-diaminopimelate ligase [Rudaea sp.]|uniref:UDP-N-acetylmuramate:L-alanyl-gamma-D-glutamyl- meso-diaminopimelate ligase n=1 Tax=unclassified Rudaea TaxID=2627037 RepID=UPI0010F74AB1|nr:MULTISPECIES: UDP-N-acetylmuramate:L-alanyl-gamma-D-glutamyl-meso-diaminopimelate ligase [unclassified Rudaea]MBN8886939.1 UDP-N-acetylmuramate:L-alanyl-gamma-D-glutamyl-meso-diaminopimelate ligase [Rudaea sp.]
MKLHILGIAGTFMGGVAALARELGHEVEGSDQNIYPPMSDQLAALGIALKQGYRAEHLQADADSPAPDLVVVGNALSRGNPAVEYLLNARLSYVSGPQWIGDALLRERRVFAVAGTHGKTTTTAMLAWILEACGREPGFLVGGVPENFGVSARLGASPDFVIEADEYDTAFFDKRSKFVHYHAQIAILNNLEFDHADIFPDVAAIQRQFHHLVRTVPGNGHLIVNAEDRHLAEVLALGAWSPVTTFGLDRGDWRARLIVADGSEFAVIRAGEEVGIVRWPLIGRHNVANALAALAAAHAGGADIGTAIASLADFRSAKRRMELVGEAQGIKVYDDFAHHPTAIATTLAGLRAKVGKARILVGMEPRSNSMRLGAHADELAPSLADADAVVFLRRAELPWDAAKVTDALHGRGHTAPTVDALIAALREQAKPGDHVVFMSNGGFENAPRRFVAAVAAK